MASAAGPEVEGASPDGSKSAQASLLGEGMYIFLLTVLAYAASMTFEFGYATRFGIPYEFISIGIGNIVYFGMALLVAATIMGQYLHSFMQFAQSVEGPDAIPFLFIKKYGIVIFLSISMLAAFDANWNLYLVLASWCLIPLAGDLFPTNRFFGDETYAEHVKDMLKRPLGNFNDTKGGFFASKPFMVVFNLFSLILLGTMICFLLGMGWARYHQSFPIVGGDQSPEVVLRRYNDRYLLAKFNPVTSRLSGEFRFVVESDFKDSVRTITIGTLLPPLAKTFVVQKPDVTKKVEEPKQQDTYQPPEEM